MARLTQKQKTTVVKIISRWAHTFAGTHPVNMDRIAELIACAYKGQTYVERTYVGKGKKRKVKRRNRLVGMPTIHEVKSPIAFDIAQAVCRGYLSKVAAENICKQFGMDASFIASLRRDTLLTIGQRYGRYNWSTSPLLSMWKATMAPAISDAIRVALDPPDRWNRGGDAERETPKRFTASFDVPKMPQNINTYYLQNNTYSQLTQIRQEIRGVNALRIVGNFYYGDPENPDLGRLTHVPWSSNADNAMHDRHELADAWGERNNYMDAEILCHLMGVTDLNQTWTYELMHEASNVMTFNRHVLVLADRPTLRTNADGELHCEDGPAVTWADGAKQYYVDGHALGLLGKKIVEKPEELTLRDIADEPNEEIKRLAIEKFGWNRYLAEVGATVLDRRENYVDNTVEALVSIPDSISRRSWDHTRRDYVVNEVRIEKRKLILACRSTGRQYFLAVPDDVRTCEDGQRWMANGANSEHVPAFTRTMRLVGAS